LPRFPVRCLRCGITGLCGGSAGF